MSEKISEAIAAAQRKQVEMKENLFLQNEYIEASLEKICAHFAAHCRLMADIKNLVKSMAKVEECSKKAQQFISEYRNYSEHFMPLLHRSKKEITGTYCFLFSCFPFADVCIFLVEEVKEMMGHMVYLQQYTEDLYDALLNMDMDLNDRSRPPLLRQESVLMSPYKKLVAKQSSIAKGQQRNSYAMGVWRRVRLKLEGRDPDPGRKYSIQEQVQFLVTLKIMH